MRSAISISKNQAPVPRKNYHFSQISFFQGYCLKQLFLFMTYIFQSCFCFCHGGGRTRRATEPGELEISGRETQRGVTGRFRKCWERSHVNMIKVNKHKLKVYHIHETGMKRCEGQIEPSRTSQNSTNWVIFRNGKYLEMEIARLGTYTSYPESLYWCAPGSNKTYFHILWRIVSP